ncbi:hypothetical protein CWI37_1823p0010 [Hamiltosporidium tvaerminnensis]|uniref:Uncharacterized protein n=1 Tax=Hamiltosporidium tvaerminnensis TaxID=1176355 RepID=A0A4Q9KTZ9_9MICR|nr:hypothetical protein CWI37_1823p0010 [Hamiltosporidium tvaerminnensis]
MVYFCFIFLYLTKEILCFLSKVNRFQTSNFLEGEIDLSAAGEHRKQALLDEDMFMAEHLRSEGYSVVPPRDTKNMRVQLLVLLLTTTIYTFLGHTDSIFQSRFYSKDPIAAHVYDRVVDEGPSINKLFDPYIRNDMAIGASVKDNLAPIQLTENEKRLEKLNNPVTIDYLVRPKQMLLLMHH